MRRFSNPEVSIDCPNCGRPLRKRLSQLGNGRTFRCLCGTQIRMKGHGATDVKRSLDKLERTIRRISR